MRYEGLLTEKEARDSGFIGPWNTYYDNGSVFVVTRVGDGWDGGSGVFNEAELIAAGLAGFAPPSGFTLPMECAPRDGRWIMISLPYPVAEWCPEAARWLDAEWRDENGTVWRLISRGTWSPIVRAIP